MAKAARKNGKIKNDQGNSVKISRVNSNNIRKEPATQHYEKVPAKVEKSLRVARNTDQNIGKNKEVPGGAIASILFHSMTKPESRMTTIEKMEATSKGISKMELEALKKRAGLDYDQLSHILQVARATLIAKKGAEKFPALLSEKIMSVADVYSYGYKVFGTEHAFNKWIFEPLGALGGKSPYDILDNVYGREEVKHIIGRIDYGVYS